MESFDPNLPPIFDCYEDEDLPTVVCSIVVCFELQDCFNPKQSPVFDCYGDDSLPNACCYVEGFNLTDGFNPKLLPIFDSYPIEENTTNQISVAKRNVYPCCNPQHFAAMLVHNTLAVEYVCIITFGCCSQLASTMVATMGIACWKPETNSVHSNPLTAITYWKRPEQKGMANFVFDPGGFQCSKNRVDSSSRRGV